MNVLRLVLKGWTLKRMLLSIAMLSMLASTAMAASVTLTGSQNGTYTLNNMSVDSNGNITLVSVVVQHLHLQGLLIWASVQQPFLRVRSAQRTLIP